MYPKSICLNCKQLVNIVFELKFKHEKTSQLLKNLFAAYEQEKKPSEEHLIEDVKEDIDVNLEETIEDIKPDEKFVTLHNTSDSKEFILVVEGPEEYKFDTLAKEDDIKSEGSINICETENNPVEEQKEVDINNKKSFHVCPTCRIDVSSAQELRAHAVSHKILKKYLKGLVVPSKARFVAKPRSTTTIFNRTPILHQCIFCSQELLIHNFPQHLFKHHNQTEYSCDQCDRVFRRLNHLKCHRVSHLKVLPYQCDICDKGFVLKENYECHILIHTRPNDLPYKCTKCNKGFSNKKHLYHHSFRHTDEGSFWSRYKVNRCMDCLQTFESAKDLQQHKLQKHENVVKKRKRKIRALKNDTGLFICKMCTETFNEVVDLKRHIRKNHESKSLCSECGISVLNLKQHMLSHQDKKPLECVICHKLLASKITLNRHIRIHTGERPYQCSVCGKAFKDHHTMRVHERIHKGDKKHACTICGKPFLEKAYMLKHMKSVHCK